MFRHNCYDPLRLNIDHVRQGGALVVDAIVRAMGLPPDTRTSSAFGSIDPKAEDPSGDALIVMVALRRICMAIHEPLDSDAIDLRGGMGDHGAEIASEILHHGNQQQYVRPS